MVCVPLLPDSFYATFLLPEDQICVFPDSSISSLKTMTKNTFNHVREFLKTHRDAYF